MNMLYLDPKKLWFSGLLLILTLCLPISSVVGQNLSISVTTTSPLCYFGFDGTATANIDSGGVAPFTFAWSNGGTTQVNTGMNAGFYSVIVTDAIGDTASKSFEILDPSALGVFIQVINYETCFGASDGHAVVNASGGTQPYTYLWNNGETTDNATSLPQGLLEVTVTDANGCTELGFDFMQGSSSALSASITSISDVSCAFAFDGSATVTPTGGTSPYFYQWSTGGASDTETMMFGGPFTVTVTDDFGCTATASGTINEPSMLDAFVIPGPHVTCNGGSDGFVLGLYSGGTMPYTYTWSNGSTTADLNNVPAGTYTVTLTDSNGCTSIGSGTVTEPAPMMATITNVNNVSCFGLFDGSATVSVTGGSSPYYYQWSDGSTSSTLFNVTSGTYTVTVSSIGGGGTCEATASVTITEPDFWEVIAVSAGPDCFGGTASVEAQIVTPAVHPVTYLWSNGSTSALQPAVPAGTYTVTATDANGCTTISTTIAPVPFPLFITPSHTDATCGASNGSASVVASGGSGPYTYAWNTGGILSSITSLSAGTYTVTVTNIHNCSIDTTIVVGSSGSFVASTVIDSNVTCFGFSNGGATAMATGGTAPFTYLWDNSATTASITGVTAGTYAVTITDNSGCTGVANATITEPLTSLSSTIAQVMDVTCFMFNDGSATVLATGGTSPYTYTWSTGGTISVESGMAGGPFTVTVTDNNGCTSTSSDVVGEPVEVFAFPQVDNHVSCNGGSDGSISLIGGGGVAPLTYTWSNGVTTMNNPNVPAGFYNVTVTDGNGCFTSNGEQVTEPTALNAAILTASNPSCGGGNNGSTSAAASGGTSPYTFIWSNGVTSNNNTGLAAGTYTVTVSDNNGCTDSTSISLVGGSLSANAVVDSNAQCHGFSNGGATASATGGSMPYTYTWSNGATTASISGLSAGTYTVTVTENGGCSSSASVTITEPDFWEIVAVSGTPSCVGGSDGDGDALISGPAPFPMTFLWSNGSTTQFQTMFSAGTYTVTATDANGCTSTDMTTVGNPPLLTITPSHTDETCGAANGSASVTASGGGGVFTYAWNTGATTPSITGLSAGTYTVTVTNTYLCSIDTTIVVNNSGGVSASAAVDTNVSCFGAFDGGAAATVIGGTAPFTYLWSTTATTNFITGVPAGTYSVTVTDNSGCTDTAIVTITQPTQLNLTATGTDASCGLANGSASALASAGTGLYTYMWSNGATTNNISGLTAGTYSVTVIDLSLCTATAMVTIGQTSSITASAVVDMDASCHNGSDGAATAIGSGGTVPYTYNWNNGATTASITNLFAGTYSVTVTDNNGCSDSASATVLHPTPLNLTATGSNANCGLANGSAGVAVSGGTSPYSYSWSNGANTDTTSGLSAGLYTVTVTDNNGCTATETVSIGLSGNVTVSATVDSNVSCNGFFDGVASASASGGTMPYTYVWVNGFIGQTNSGLSAGVYSITVYDGNGCMDSSTVSISQPVPLTVVGGVQNNVSCHGLADGAAFANGSGGTAPLFYNWSNGATSSSISGLALGTYTVTLTDGNGCTAIDDIFITEPGPLVATVNTVNTSCGASNGAAAVVHTGGTPPYTYQWNTGSSSDSLNGVSTGTYSVTVTDVNNCVAFASGLVGSSGGINVSASVDSNVTCNGFSDGGASAFATAGVMPYTYAWSNGAITSSITGVTAGTYTATVSDANGCSNTASATITQTSPINLSVSSSNTPCGIISGVATVTPSGGASPYSFIWNTGATQNFLNPVPAGTYTVTVTDANGCTASGSTTISTTNPVSITAFQTQSVVCFGQSSGAANTTVTGGFSPYTYTWSNLGSVTGSNTNLAAGTYSVTVSDQNGCTDSASVTILQSPPINASITINNQVLCNGSPTGSLTASATAGFPPVTYTWNTGQVGPNLNSLSGGTYTVTVSDLNGCSEVVSATLSQGSQLNLSATSTDATCGGGNDGTAFVQASGGIAPYTYAWSNGATTAALTGLSGGTYSVTVSDANGCSGTTSVVVNQTASLNLSLTATDVSCNGGSDGTITSTASGGSMPYNFLWSSGATTANLNNLSAGTYTVTLTDFNGCSVVASATVSQGPQLNLSATSTDATCGGGNDGTASVQASGGLAPYTYAWSNGATTAAINGLAGGTYSVTATDANGCSGTTSVVVNQTASLNLSLTATDVSCNGGSDGTISSTVSGGSMPYLFLWSNGATTANLNNLSAGTYTVTLTDNSGCSATMSTTVGQPAGMSIAFSTIAQTNGGPDGSATTTVTGGSPSYSYVWNTGLMLPNLNNVFAGTYTVTVTDGTGCTAVGSVTVPFDSTSAGYTQLGAQCNSTMNAMNEFLYYFSVPGATNYRFQITATGFSTVYVLGSPLDHFRLDLVPGVTYNTTYTIQIAAYANGLWGAYGQPCTVTTPANIPTTSLNTSSCNSFLNNLTDNLYIDPVPQATNYRYEITSSGGFNTVYTVGYQWTHLKLSQVSGVQYNTTYNIRVAAFVNGSWGAYGPSCTVTTAANIPTNKLAPVSCDITMSSLSDVLYLIPVPGATNYRYEITTSGGFNYVHTAGYQTTQFRMFWIPGVQYGETYNIRTAAYVGGWGAYGDVCTVTTPATIPTTSLRTAWCNQTFTNWTDIVYVFPVPGATRYRYRFSIPGGSTTVYERNSTAGQFFLHWMPGLVNNTTYNVDVAAQVGGVWGSYGSVCTLTTPTAPLRTGFFDEVEVVEGPERGEINVFPNPNHGNFTLQANLLGDGEYTLELYDLSGRIIHRAQLWTTEQRLNHQINLGQDLPQGAYLLRLSGNSELYHKHVVIH